MVTTEKDAIAATSCAKLIVDPLIQETAQKVQLMLPQQAQTGPAKRHDDNTLQKHLELLPKGSDKEKIYRSLTEIIKSKFF